MKTRDVLMACVLIIVALTQRTALTKSNGEYNRHHIFQLHAAARLLSTHSRLLWD